MSDPISTGIAAGADLAKTAADSAQAEQTNAASTNEGPAETHPLAIEAVKALTPSETKANEGIQKAADIEKKVVAPTAAGVKQSGQRVQTSAEALQATAAKEYNDAVQYTHDATIRAESAVKLAADNAKVDPQAYLHSLGTTDKVLTSIGMLLGGFGSGLTGQPNVAIELYKKNTENAIQAQTQTYKNLMESAAQAKGFVLNGQERQMLAAAAYNAATISVMSGNNAAIEGATKQAGAESAPPLADQAKFGNDLRNVDAHGKFGSMYKTVHESGDKRKINILGIGTGAIADHASGTNTFSLSPNSPGQRAGAPDKPGYSLYPKGTPGNPTPQPAPAAAPKVDLSNTGKSSGNNFQTPYYKDSEGTLHKANSNLLDALEAKRKKGEIIYD